MPLKVTIDGKEYESEQGQTVLDVANKNGIRIPTLCFNPLYSEHRSGACRLCMVETTGGGKPGLQSSCTLQATDGLKISTNSESVFQARRTIIELLLSEHTMDCRNCPTSGECHFAEMCREYDINGVAVCAECPNQKDGCLLSRHVLCMGPITYANCDAYCTRRGYRCEGCHSVLAHEDVLKFGLKAYEKAGFTPEEILEGAKVYSYDGVDRLRRVMVEIGMLKKGVK